MANIREAEEKNEFIKLNEENISKIIDNVNMIKNNLSKLKIEHLDNMLFDPVERIKEKILV